MSDDPAPTIRDSFPPATPPADPLAPIAPVAPVAPVRPLAPAPVAKKGSSGMWLNLLLVVAAAVAIGGVAFALGRSTAPVAAAAARGGFGNGQFGANFPGGSFDPNASFPVGAAGGFGGRGANVGVTGTVESISPDSITVKTANGSVTISLDGTTTYHESSSATAAAVTTGATVTVRVGGLGRGQAQGAGASPGASGTPALTATDVTVGQ